MCGRYLVKQSVRDWLRNALPLVDNTPDDLWRDRYNVPPDARGQIPVVRLDQSGQAELVALHWSYLPRWLPEKAKWRSIATAEQAPTNGFFRDSFRKRRALVPVSGFYEWDHKQTPARPNVIHLHEWKPFFLGAIWDTWHDETGIALITTAANQAMQPIHHRMPLIIEPERALEWLTTDTPEAFLKPYAGGNLLAHTVGLSVNDVRNDGPELIQAAR